MQAAPWPPNAVSFQRSGSTENCCQRCSSVEPSRLCGVMRFVSGTIAYSSSGSIECDFLKKYWTCEPGVSSPSGMIFVNSFVVSDPRPPAAAPGRGHVCRPPPPPPGARRRGGGGGGVGDDEGELLAVFVVSITKH